MSNRIGNDSLLLLLSLQIKVLTFVVEGFLSHDAKSFRTWVCLWSRFSELLILFVLFSPKPLCIDLSCVPSPSSRRQSYGTAGAGNSALTHHLVIILGFAGHKVYIKTTQLHKIATGNLKQMRMRLCSNKTLLVKSNSGLDFTHRFCVLTPALKGTFSGPFFMSSWGLGCSPSPPWVSLSVPCWFGSKKRSHLSNWSI